MKVWTTFLLAASCLAHQMQNDYHQFKNWAEAKAMESCWGKENNKIYVINMKKAVAKCQQQDAPELELPPYRSSYRFVNILTSSADDMERNKMEQIYNMMKLSQHHQSENNARYTPYGHSYMMKKMMMKYKMEQMREKFMNEGSYGPTSYQMSYSPEDEMQFANKANFNFRILRSARAAGDKIKPIDLGDKLITRINAQNEAKEAEIGNMTCVLKEMSILNADNEIDVRSMKIKLNEYNQPSEWFKNRSEDIIDNCFEMANNLPANIEDQSIFTREIGKKLTYGRTYVHTFAQIKHFLKCYKDYHKKLCMDQDTKKNIESNYGPLEEILEQTGLTQYQLFTAFVQLSAVEGNDYFGF